MLDSKFNAVSQVKLLDAVEEHKGDDEYLQVLYSTANSFTLSWPALNRSITVDKKTKKAQEHDLFTSSDTKVIHSKVCGFLGILPIYGLDHFVIATERKQVCELPTYKQPLTNATSASVFALKEVQLIPFDVDSAEGAVNGGSKIEEEKKDAAASQSSKKAKGGKGQDREKIEEVVQKIKKYLQEGFYFSYNYDLTSNLQRQRRLYE